MDKINKSKMIREFYKTNTGLGPTAIAKAMSHGKFQVSPALVSQVLKKKRKGKRARINGAAAVPAGEQQISLSTILAAKKLADSVGGVQNAKAAVDMLVKVLG